jgi:hypothetical protein
MVATRTPAAMGIMPFGVLNRWSTYALAAKDSPGGLTDEDAPWLSRITTAV